MDKVTQLKNEKNAYKKNLENIEKIVSNLDRSISILKNMIELQGKCYVVDDINGGSNTLSHLLEKENSIYSNIVNNTIPAVKSKISRLDNKIKEAKAEEAVESSDNKSVSSVASTGNGAYTGGR